MRTLLNKFRRTVFVMLAVLSLSVNSLFNISADPISDLKDKQVEINEQSQKAKDLLEDTQVRKSNLLEDILRMDVQLEESEIELQFITGELDKTKALLEEARRDLEEARLSKENQSEVLKKRIRYMYESGNSGYLDVLFDAADLSELINRYEYMSKIIEFDDDLFTKYAETEKTIAEKVVEIDTKEKEQEILVKEQEDKHRDIEVQIENKNVIMQELIRNEQMFMQQIEDFEQTDKEIEQLIKDAEAKAEAYRIASDNKAYEAAKAEAYKIASEHADEKARAESVKLAIKRAIAERNAEMARAAAENPAIEKPVSQTPATEESTVENPAADVTTVENASIAGSADESPAAQEPLMQNFAAETPESTSNTPSEQTGNPGAFGWPVSGDISDVYGDRINPISGKPEFHTGLDIAIPTGTDVVAAADGIVIVSRYMSGYGNTVIIDHGGTISTLYGHNSRLLVSIGDEVVRGDVIAKSGSTGYSTGPHCHFEVRINGTHTNPLEYLH